MQLYKTFVVEKRKADGTLDFSEPQPPFITATEDQLCDYWFRKNPDAPNPDIKDVYAWYHAQGFMTRPKTW